MNKKNEKLYENYQGEYYKDRAAAIRSYCLDCCCEDATEVRECLCVKCPLYMYRMGREDGFKIMKKEEAGK